jgi:hypothetical protein
MAALSEDERHRLAILEDRRRRAADKARRRALGGNRAARKALEAAWEPVREYQRERGQE